jgi:multimeric flavodoxin WrbA
MEKVLILMGSPRPNGNVAKMSEWVSKAAEIQQFESEIVYLNSLDIKPCQACMGCKIDGNSGCVIKDDMEEMYNKIEKSDIIVFATPVYFFSLPTQIKTVIDRFYAYGPDFKGAFEGKRFGLLMAYGADDLESSGGKNAVAAFKDISDYFDVELLDVVHCTGCEPGELEKNEDIKRHCEEMVVKFVK